MKNPSNGYEAIAVDFIRARSHTNGVGADVVGKWALSLPYHASVLDLGCGTGFPISNCLIDAGLDVFAIDASPTLVAEFQKKFSNLVRCETVEDSTFFDRKFDAFIAWGLLFLMMPENQKRLIEKISRHLNSGGRFLFTAPRQKVRWNDAMTNLPSRSLGIAVYKKILFEYGFTIIGHHYDSGENHYFECVKIK